MATTVTNPNYWTLTLTSDTTPVFNFKYVVDIWIDGVRKVRLKQPKNAAGSAHVSFEKVVKSFLEPTHKHDNTIIGTDYDSIHLMPQNPVQPSSVVNDPPFSTNTDTLKLVTFKFSEEYASTDGGEVTITATTASNLTLPFINYSDEWVDGREFDSAIYDFDSSGTYLSRFLSELPTYTYLPNSTAGLVPHLTSFNDYKTFSFLNDATPYFDTTDLEVVFKMFAEVPNADRSNYTRTIAVPNIADFGGNLPSTASEEYEYLLYCGVGGANLKNMRISSRGDYQLQDNGTVKYYTVQARGYTTGGLTDYDVAASDCIIGGYYFITNVGDTDWVAMGAANNNFGTSFYCSLGGSGTGSAASWQGTELSEEYLFELSSDQTCNSTRFDEYTLAWVNKFGAWDYYLFNGEHSTSTKYKRKSTHTQVAGSWNSVAFNLDSFERGDVKSVEGSKSTIINTGFITEEYNDYFNSMMLSKEVVLLQPVKWGDDDKKAIPIPVNIVDSSLSYKTNLKDKLVQYSFTFEEAHKLKQRS
tara:strand:- start:2453 stop:4036 length:1584 start_codon:yes stop_codon:yes gene_type:complete